MTARRSTRTGASRTMKQDFSGRPRVAMPRRSAGSSPVIGTARSASRRWCSATPSDADDVVQVASERAWRALVDGRPAARLPLVVPAHRRQHGAQSPPGLVAPPSRRAARRGPADRATAADLVDDAVTASERDVVVAALNRLDAVDRLVIALRHFEQLERAGDGRRPRLPAGHGEVAAVAGDGEAACRAGRGGVRRWLTCARRRSPGAVLASIGEHLVVDAALAPAPAPRRVADSPWRPLLVAAVRSP